MVYLSPNQLQDGLLTLSGLPSSYFTAFLQLDSIRRRNAEALQSAAGDDEAPRELPFFLPAVSTTSGMAWVDADDDEDLDNGSTPAKVRRRGRKRMDLQEILVTGGGGGSGVLGDLESLDLSSDVVCKSQIISFWANLCVCWCGSVA